MLASHYIKSLGLAMLVAMLSQTSQAAFKLPAVEAVKLDNGLQLFFVPQNEVPLVHITLGVATGSAADGAQWGLASLTSESLSLGTKSYSKQKIEDTLDFYGIDYETSVAKDYITIEASVASAELSKLMPIFAELVISPKFPAGEVDKLRDRSVSQLKKGKESPNRIATQVFERMYYKTHPYGSPEDGVASTVQKLKANDLATFHKTHFQPQVAALTIAGDFDDAAIKTLIRQNFGQWKKGTATALKVDAPVPPVAATEVLLLDKDDARETTFRIGGLGNKAFDKDWVKFAVINTVLGGRFTSVLNEELRVKSGYTYGAKSSFNDFASSGIFLIATFTANETTFKALDLALETYKKFVTNGIDQKTLDSAKAYVKGQYPPRYETLSSLADLTTKLWAWGLPLDTLNQFEAQVDSMTLTEANQLIKSALPNDKLEILLIGKAKDIAEPAKKYGAFRQHPIAVIDQSTPL